MKIDKEKLKTRITKLRRNLKTILEKWKKTKLRCKLHKFFTVKTFSKGDIVILSLIFISGVILYYPLWKFIFFVVVTDLGWFSGKMGLKKIREKLEKAEQIIENPNIPISRKYVEAVDAVHTTCDHLGRVMDRYNLKQGTAPYLKDLEKQMGGERENGSVG